jgi:heparanase 1
MRNFLFLLALLAASALDLTATVNPALPVGHTNEGYICVNLDWWPKTKCDYDRCPWGEASIQNLDITNPLFRTALSALAAASPSNDTLTLRLGGSMADYIQYNTSAAASERCIPWEVTNTTRLGFELYSQAKDQVVGPCLQPQRLIDILKLCDELHCRVAFGINAMNGRTTPGCPEGTRELCWKNKPTPACCTEWNGNWDPTNAASLLAALKEAGVKPWALEFGNELVGAPGIESHLNASVYFQDFERFADTVQAVWPGAGSPILVAPDTNLDKEWFADFMSRGPRADVITRHAYTLGAGVDPAAASKALDPKQLNKDTVAAQQANTVFKAHAHQLQSAHAGYPQLVRLMIRVVTL